MSTTPPVPPDRPETISPELKEMLDFISQENDRNRVFFNDLFEKSRNFLLYLLAAISLAVTFFGYRTIADAKKTAEEAASRVVHDRLEALRPDIDKRMNDQIGAQFATPKITALIDGAAVEATKNLADPLIREQVGQRVDSAMLRVEPQVHSLIAFSDEVTQNSLAKTGLGSGFDRLDAMAHDPKLAPSLRKSAADDWRSDADFMVKYAATQGSGCDVKRVSLTQIKEDLASDNADKVFSALGCLDPHEWKARYPELQKVPANVYPSPVSEDVAKLYPFMDQLYNLALSAHLATERIVATWRMLQLAEAKTGGVVPSFRPLESENITAWWKAHRSEYIR